MHSFDSQFNGREIKRAAICIDGVFDHLANNIIYQLDTGAPVTHIFQGTFPDMKIGGSHKIWENVHLFVRPMPGIGAPYNPDQMNVVGIMGLDFLKYHTGSFGFDFKRLEVIFECESDNWVDYSIINGHIYLKNIIVNGENIDSVMYDSGCSAFTISLHCENVPAQYDEKLELPGSFGKMNDVYLLRSNNVMNIAGQNITFNELGFSQNVYDGMNVAMMGNMILDERIIFFRKDGKYTIK